MADNESGEQEESKDRATVALVNAKVATVDAKIDGIGTLLKAEFGHLKEDIRALAGVAGQVIHLEASVEDLGRRVKTLEKRAESEEQDRDDTEKVDREFRRANLPTIIFAGIVAIVAIIELIQQFH